MTALTWIEPEWPAPRNVRAAATTRAGGVSQGAFASLNLAMHVGDDPAAVAENRRRLRDALQLPAEPAWLNQVHGNEVVEALPRASVPTADASVAKRAGQVCVVMTADCLPVLFCNRQGTRVAAAHAGWRGLAGGVLTQTVRALGADPQDLLAWLGPAIEQPAFEVGDEVRERFLALSSMHGPAFARNSKGRWQADLYRLARGELERLGITQVYGGTLQCHADAERFFSYRRESKTGRMASLVWMVG